MISALRNLSSGDLTLQEEAKRFMSDSRKVPAVHFPTVCAALTTILKKEEGSEPPFHQKEGEVMHVFISTCEELMDALEDENDLYEIACGTNEAVPMALVGLTYQMNSDVGGEDWNISTAAGALIQAILTNRKDTGPVVEVLLAFASQSRLEGDSWRERDAASTVIGCIFNSVKDEAVISNLISTRLSTLVKLMSDVNSTVADTAVWNIAILFEKQYGRLWREFPDMTKASIEVIITKLDSRSGGGKVVERPLQAVINLSASCAMEMINEDTGSSQLTNDLSPYFERLVTACFSQITTQQDPSQETSSITLMPTQAVAVEALAILVDACADDSTQPLIGVVESTQEFLNHTTTSPALTGMISALVAPLCGKLKAKMKSAVPALASAICSAIDANESTGLLDDQLNDMLPALSALIAIDASAPLLTLVMNTVTPLIMNIPNKNPQCGRACSNFLSDTSSVLGDKFGVHVVKLMPALLKILADSDMLEEKDIVVPMFECVSDIVLHCESSVASSLPTIKQLFKDALAKEDADEELVELIESVLNVI